MTSASNVTATPAKLRSGDWGARVVGPVQPGQIVTVRTRAGKTWDARVTRVLWARDGVALCATESIDRPARRSRRGRSTWCECGACDDLLSLGYLPGQRVRCPECGGMAEAC